MKKYRKLKKQWIFLIVVLLAGGLIASLFLWKSNEKKAFDYEDYYVPLVLDKNETESAEENGYLLALSLDLLKKENDDVAAIIEFDDRMIYEPIVQAKDNQYYVHRNLLKKKTSAGIPFIDCNSSLDAVNTVIYGHSSVYRNILFTPLMQYKEKEFWEDHSTFILDTGVKEMYQIFSVFVYDTQDDYQAPDFVLSNWENKTDYAYFLVSLKERSLFDTGISVDSSDKLVTLVTCDTENLDQRLILVAKKI